MGEFMAKKSFNEIVKSRIAAGELVCPAKPQGVTKGRISEVLTLLDRSTADMRDVVFALLDTGSNWFPAAPPEATFGDGATTAHIGAHVGILQRGGDSKLDREGRDYWLKPLVDIGAIEWCYLPSTSDTKLLSGGNQFYPGHPKAKSPNNAYRLTRSFVEILTADEGQWKIMLGKWIGADETRKRLELQAILAEQVRKLTDNSHSELILLCAENYVPKFLPDFRVVYIDDGDGDRITGAQKDKLEEVGLEITLHDAMPDLLLVNGALTELWVVEAVTSDGEVDNHKKKQMTAFAQKHGMKVGFTTAYPTWKKVAERQKKTGNNLAVGSYLWVMEDGSKNYKIEG
jgi:hypothetical protein